MFSYKVFSELCEKANVTPYRVAKETGLATAMLTEWKKNYESNGKQGYVPKYDKIVLIAQFFDVSTDVFLGKEGE